MVSSAVAFVGGLVTGAVFGVLGFLLYMRHRTKKQLKQMEEQMGQVMDLQAQEEE